MFSTRTNSNGQFTINDSLPLRIPSGSQQSASSTTYTVEAEFSGDEVSNSTAWSNLLGGTTYAACATIQYDYQPCFNITALTVYQASTQSTTPAGSVPSFYEYVDAWHGPWWWSYHLTGWILSWGQSVGMTIGLVLAILGLLLVTLTTGGIVLAVIGLVFAVAPLYTASNGNEYSYYDTIFLYGIIPLYGEAGFHTNSFYTRSLGQWYYMPVYPSGALPHTGVWPNGF